MSKIFLDIINRVLFARMLYFQLVFLIKYVCLLLIEIKAIVGLVWSLKTLRKTGYDCFGRYQSAYRVAIREYIMECHIKPALSVLFTEMGSIDVRER